MKSNSENKIVVIVGPTAVGKSSLAIHLAKQHDGEIISADSRQVYTGLDIGTGKITLKEMEGIPHHLLDVADPTEQFTASDFQRLGRAALRDIQSRGKLPIICGGTGMYVDALLGKMFLPEVAPNPTLRSELAPKSTEELFAILTELDPRRAQTIDKHNPRRLIRAIEITKTLGKVPDLQPTTDNAQRNQILWIGINLPPAKLKKNITIRLFVRISEMNMIDEALQLHKKGLSWKRMEELGLEYRYLARYLQEKVSKADMLRLLEVEIVHYAKRQMVWFKKNTAIHWFSPSSTEKIEEEVANFLQA